MDINKAIRKQKKSFIYFMLSMCFIFFVLPVILLVLKRESLFFLSYLAVIEVLIVSAVLFRINSEYLRFQYDSNKLKIFTGLFKSEININCSKVLYVDVEGREGNTTIILITKSKLRSSHVKKIDINFLTKYDFIKGKYYRLKKIHPEDNFYYLVIKNGGYYKYKLLDIIYKSCVYAYFSEEAIDKIKINRTAAVKH
jgi:hypothetical protein